MQSAALDVQPSGIMLITHFILQLKFGKQNNATDMQDQVQERQSSMNKGKTTYAQVSM